MKYLVLIALVSYCSSLRINSGAAPSDSEFDQLMDSLDKEKIQKQEQTFIKDVTALDQQN